MTSATKITIKADDECSADIFWADFDYQFPAIAEQVRKGATAVDAVTWQAIQQIEGFADGPSYAPTALVVVEG